MEEHVNTAMGNDSSSTENTQGSGADKKIRFRIATVGFVLFLVFVVGLFFLFTGGDLAPGLTLSFLAGLTMIFLPCTLPMAFVIVPMTMGKNPKKGFLMALSFGLGLAVTLSFYGVFIAFLGQIIGLSKATQALLILGGGAAFFFGLSEIGLIKFRLPSYTGKFPDFIQKQGDYIKTFLLGLFLGNAGVGCPNPAFYVLMGYIATVGDLFNGWFLGFIHGIGRAVPLIFLAILGILGINATSKIAGKQESIERYMGWVLVVIGAFILTFGIFGHDWFVLSGTHTTWEAIVSTIGGENFTENILQHGHKLVEGQNFLKFGNAFFLGLVGLTMFLFWKIKKPSKRHMRWLLVMFISLVLFIGYSTGWSFTLNESTGGHSSATETVDEHSHDVDVADDHEHTDEGMMEESAVPGSGFIEAGSVTEGLSVDFAVTPINPIAGDITTLEFFVNEKPDRTPVTDLQIEHEKYMHVIGVRNDLSNFFHIHPEDGGGNKGVWRVEHIFENPGVYKVWSDIRRNNVTTSFGHNLIEVSGDGVAESETVEFLENVIIKQYQVALDLHGPITVGNNTEISFILSDVFGRGIELEEYLGADMHLAIIKDDLEAFIHTHPGVEGHDEEVQEHSSIKLINEAQAHVDENSDLDVIELTFNATFKKEGVYKMFAQFIPVGAELEEGEALVAEFYIKVESDVSSAGASLDEDFVGDGHDDHGHTPDIAGVWYEDKTWWTLFLTSLFLIVLLVFGVKKYLQVKD